MNGYVTMGTNDIERAVSFYDALLATIGVKRLWMDDSMAAWGPSRRQVALCVATPFGGSRASTGNGAMVALKVGSQQHVRALHAKALELGGPDEGEPGPRGEHGFFGGYFRDMDGNKMNAYVPAISSQ
ncbi:MAG: catechol 2,3-dioxygenase-like lactoylglutathione lyase family enzyme [Planctomycetota bacterium]|jgi:catechol 2,3-dioxygenase-like lactoylglutathione lyase family enzyme